MTVTGNKFKFDVIYGNKRSKARAGRITTPHGMIDTPAFVPVGTQASVKSLTPQDLKEIGVQIFFGNTYHLHLRPGEDVVKEFGGLGKFMGWEGPTITDSGGFQLFSLNRRTTPIKTRISADQRIDQRESAPTLVKIKDDGVTFRSHIDGSLHEFTPEKSIEIQKKLGADIILAFDECSPYPSTHQYAKQAMERTHKWAQRSLAEFKVQSAKFKANAYQALYGIIQGGVYKDLREESAKFISSLPFDGIAIGGVAVGESKKEMLDVLDWVVPLLPEDKPRHLLGVGEIDDIFDSIERGMDTMDCVIPTRLGRYGFIFVSPPEGNRKNKFMIDIKKSIFAKDQRPIAKDCKCNVCKTFTRGYVHHLFRVQELLAYRVASYHNLYFINNLFAKIRKSILEGRFEKLKKEWIG